VIKLLDLSKCALASVLILFCGATYAETPIEDNEYVIIYHSDVLGSPVAVSDGQGRVLWYENTDPYGDELGRISGDYVTSVGNLIVESSDSRMGYTGHEKDSTSGLTYMKARYYDPVIGRFYSNDPVPPFLHYDLFNRYEYAYGNPYSYVDPDGRQPDEDGDGVPDEDEYHRDPDIEIVSLNPSLDRFERSGIPAGAPDTSNSFWDSVKDIFSGGDKPLNNQPGLPPAKTHQHHLFPQKYREFFSKLGIDIDKHAVTLGEKTHLEGVHGKGLGNMPGKWNQQWGDFIKNNPNATSKDAYQQLGKMMDSFNLGDAKIHTYIK